MCFSVVVVLFCFVLLVSQSTVLCICLTATQNQQSASFGQALGLHSAALRLEWSQVSTALKSLQKMDITNSFSLLGILGMRTRQR